MSGRGHRDKRPYRRRDAVRAWGQGTSPKVWEVQYSENLPMLPNTFVIYLIQSFQKTRSICKVARESGFRYPVDQFVLRRRNE